MLWYRGSGHLFDSPMIYLNTSRELKLQPHWRIAAGLLAGIMMPFAFSPYDHAWLVIPSLAMFFWLIQHGNPIQAGFFFGFGWFGFGAWWLAPTLHTYGHLPWIAAGLCVLLVGLVMAMLPAIWAWLAWRLAGKSPWLMLSFAVAAVFEEWLRGHLFSGLPWTALGNVLLATEAVGWASWFGVYALSFLPALMAAALALCLQRNNLHWGLTGLAMALLLLWAAPTIPPDNVGSQQPVKTAALIQGNIPQDEKWDAAFLNETMQRYAGLSAEARADIIIWPEAAVPFFLSRAPAWNTWLSAHIQGWQTPLLFGGLKDFNDGTAQNGLFSELPVAPSATNQRGFAGKQHLVPFGEYVPEWIPFLHTLVPEIADFRPAADSGTLDVDDVRYGALICYESLFPELSRSRVLAGAQVLVNVTNDAWYGQSPAAWQHLQAARMRAVETGRYVLRAANTGVSAIIAPSGEITASIPWWTTASLQGQYRPSDAITHYVRLGDWPLLTGLLILLVPIFRRFNP